MNTGSPHSLTHRLGLGHVDERPFAVLRRHVFDSFLDLGFDFRIFVSGDGVNPPLGDAPKTRHFERV